MAKSTFCSSPGYLQRPDVRAISDLAWKLPTLVNLLVQKIANGQPYIPGETASHLFGGPSKKHLVDIWEADQACAKTLSLCLQPPAAQSIAWPIPESEALIANIFSWKVECGGGIGLLRDKIFI